MTPQEFDYQFKRLDSRWPRTYVVEVTKVLWRSMKDFPAEWLSAVVDEMLVTQRQAPMMGEFGPKIAEERERRWRREKEINAREAKEFFRTKFSPDDQRHAIREILRRVTGQMPDRDWANFRESLNNAAFHAQPVNCTTCEDSGLVWAFSRLNGSESVFKCRCRSAGNDLRHYPVWGAQYFRENTLRQDEAPRFNAAGPDQKGVA